ncbi:MAG: hypothetical protein RMI91_09615 [Gemmatales bacterium]|nr:hypothetical protein [Gemmatales bacterium]MDW7994897.1 hypothetical protein [Gemmatales bacterium]
MSKMNSQAARLLPWGVVLALMVPTGAHAQILGQGTLEPFTPHFLPLGPVRQDGIYVAGEAIFFRVNSSIKSQVVARRGLVDTAGNIFAEMTVDQNGTDDDDTDDIVVIPPQPQPGRILGSNEVALRTDQVRGDDGRPGLRLTIGYRFPNDVTIEGVFWLLPEHRRSAWASILPPNLQQGDFFSRSFLYAPFYNVPVDFIGPTNDVQQILVTHFINPDAPDEVEEGDEVPAYGVFNGAELFRVTYKQEFYNYELNVRFPTYPLDVFRTYTSVGLRYLRSFERFELIAEDLSIDGSGLAVGRYRNRWTNNLFGVQGSYGGEVYLGYGFALLGEVRAGLFYDDFHARTEATVEGSALILRRKHTDANLSPMLGTGVFLYWYPVDSVVVRIGYEFLGFFNVIRSTEAIDFNLGTLEPTFRSTLLRFDGFSAGIAIRF